MSLTTTDLHLSLAYRIGETSVPGDTTTKNQRLEWMNQGYMEIARRKNWWWLEAIDTSNSNTGSTTGYNEPTDLKEFIELKVGTVFYDQVPYRRNREGSMAVVSLPMVRTNYQYYRFGGKYYFMQTDAADSTTHTIHYYKRVTKVADGGTFLIPDEYLEALVAYAEARYWMSITQQNKAVVGMQEFEEMIKQMSQEDRRRGVGHKFMTEIRDPEDAYY